MVPTSFSTWRTRCVAISACIALAACASLPVSVDAPPSHAIDPSTATALGRVAAASLSAPAGSGFQLLPVASAAFETRVALANQAERSLDVQTFVFDADDTGKYLLDSLRAAAARGVRVRLLIDDLNTAGTDALLAGFACEPHVEVRLFNPFANGRSSLSARLLESLHELDRVNHRMHNKLFIADNALAVFGGRNTGDEYFMRAKRGNFVDFDVLAAGAVVPELSRSFDAYWNSAYAYPARAVIRGLAPVTDAEFRRLLGPVEPPPLDETVPMRLSKFTGAPAQLAAGRLDLIPAEGIVRADPVDKVAGTRLRDRGGTVRDFVASVMRSAHHEVFVISPYFVPGELGMAAMRELRAAGVDLVLLTNSLAATDEPMVHGGYLRYRRDMLEIGVKIYELSPSLSRQANELSRFGGTNGALHAKIIVVDRERLFVGSMNMDTRSERYNTELGVLMESPALAASFLDLIHFKASAYRVRLAGEDRHLEWVSGEGEFEKIWRDEPEASPWLQFKARLLGGFVPEGWL